MGILNQLLSLQKFISMYKSKISSLITPILTPFSSDGRIAENFVSPFVQFLTLYTAGFFICGSFGSGVMMEIPEHQRMLELVVAANTGIQKQVITHIGTTSTHSTIELPYYYPHSDAAILTHFKAFLESTNLPVYLYDYPAYTNRKVDLDLFEKLIALAVCGVKDTSGSLDVLKKRIAHIPFSQCDYLIGTEALLVPAYKMGIRGCISGLSNAFPEIVAAFLQILNENALDEISHWQTVINAVRQFIKQYSKMEAIYAILAMRGVSCGNAGAPFGTLDRKSQGTLQEELIKMNLLERNKEKWM